MFLKVCLTLLYIPVLEGVMLNNASCDSYHIEDSNVYVRCQGDFPEMDMLKYALNNITEPILVFELKDAKLDVLPSDIFKNIRKQSIKRVVFDNVSLELLSIPELGPEPFESIKHTLKSFEVYESTSVFAWNFSTLAIMKNMENLIIENSDLYSLTSFNFFPHLRLIQVLNSRVQWIHSSAFQKNNKLTICSLANNQISKIYRSMFPQPADRLWSLDLSFNRLNSLPEDMFTGMHALQELKLDNNLLTGISPDVLVPVWNKLSHLWLDGNEIYCEPFCWVKKTNNRPLFLDSSRCKLEKGRIRFSTYFENCTDV